MNSNSMTCSNCEQGHLIASTFADDFRHNDATLHIDGLECYVCDNCGADPVYPDQIRRNQLRIADAKRKADGMLVGGEIRSVREHLGLTQQEAAILFGGGANAFSKYERGDVLQSVAMDRLLKAAAFVPGVFEFLRWEADAQTRGVLGSVQTYCVRSSITMPAPRQQMHLRVVREAEWGAAEAA